VTDPACSLFVTAGEVTIGAEKAFMAFGYPSLSLGSEAFVVKSSCGCDVACETTMIAISDFRFASKVVSMAVSANPKMLPGIFKVCAGDEHVMTLTAVRAPDADCKFFGEDSPCTAPECAADPTSDMCMQILNEYCRHNPGDLGCEFLLPAYERAAGGEQMLEVFVRRTTAIAPTVVVADATCGCECANAVDLLAATFAADTRLLRIDFVPISFGDFVVCEIESGEAAAVAALTVSTPPECTFGPADDSPCMASDCAEDPFSEECTDYVADYCAKYPEDGACAYYLPRYYRSTGVVGVLELPIPTPAGEFDPLVYATATIRFIPEECECGAVFSFLELSYPTHLPDERNNRDTYEPEYNHAPVVNDACPSYTPHAIEVLDIPRNPMVNVGSIRTELKFNQIGTYRACLAPAGGAKAADFVVDLARLVVNKGESECLFALGDSPCTSGSCATDPESEACGIETAQYCADHSEDMGCAMFTFEYAALVNEPLDLSLHADLSAAGSVRAVLRRCSCLDTSCPSADVNLSTVLVDADAGLVQLELTAFSVGEYSICAAPAGVSATYDSHDLLLAHVTARDARVCAFSGGVTVLRGRMRGPDERHLRAGDGGVLHVLPGGRGLRERRDDVQARDGRADQAALPFEACDAAVARAARAGLLPLRRGV
jgi:hypothetical protein